MAKQRIDILLVELGFFTSREKAQAAIMAGLVLVDRERVNKAGTKVDSESQIEIKGNPHPYASRGGLKLEKGLQQFGFLLQNAVCLDIGASTGGFTDCMLQHGAARVYAIDVGYGQLDWKLRNDPRVVVMERTNIRHVTPEQIPEPVHFVSIDVSFISLKLVLPVLPPLLAPDCKIVALIKPQFEAGKQQVGKNGVVRDPAIQRQVITQVAFFAGELGFRLLGLDFSPIRGPKGNIEYLLALTPAEVNGIEQKQPWNEDVNEEIIQQVVASAHQTSWS